MMIIWRSTPPVLLAMALATGCGGVRAPSPAPASRITQWLENAESLARAGRYAEARATYGAIVVRGAAADAALLGLTRLALDPLNPDRDDRQAAMYLDRLIADYPQSAVMAEALTWRHLMRTIERLRSDARQSHQEVDRLSRELRREQQETARLRDERERLREIDEALERPRRSVGVPTTALPAWRPE
jgi:hypothetical protein